MTDDIICALSGRMCTCYIVELGSIIGSRATLHFGNEAEPPVVQQQRLEVAKLCVRAPSTVQELQCSVFTRVFFHFVVIVNGN